MPSKRPKRVCLNDGYADDRAHGQVHTRGVCESCYAWMRRQVAAGKEVWSEFIRRKMILPTPTHRTWLGNRRKK